MEGERRILPSREETNSWLGQWPSALKKKIKPDTKSYPGYFW